MEVVNFNRTSRWKKRPSHKSSLLPIFLFALLLFIVLFISCKHISNFLLPVSRDSPLPKSHQYRLQQTLGEKFLWYTPHSGFSNQLSEFKNAILMAAILNRTLIVPPILDHHAVVLGSCPKFRVSSPNELRISVWNHIMELIQSHRYVSMADIIDLSSLISTSGCSNNRFQSFCNWTGSYLGDLASDSDAYKLYVLREEDELVIRTAKKLVAAEHGMKFGFVPKRLLGMEKHCHPQSLPDILLYIEETVCSCGSLGFVGTAGSTIADSIELMRKYGTCLGQSLTKL
ncbi:hypothetical protein F0562_012876 [Nyssa sinensis]|uniref:O-fucosyltransferase family protein n=1 Tax=Nyssa sinensis TaxID=561372 RepID=A0A5J4ZTT8_9ASTE|nr:hypothetical protein F0562_012876 [Nyssa sinensis]